MAVGGATGQNMLKNFATSKMQKKDETIIKPMLGGRDLKKYYYRLALR